MVPIITKLIVIAVNAIGFACSHSSGWPPNNPIFLESSDNITARIGEPAYLPCSVQHLSDRSVTWMRQRDLHILTAGVFTYSADNRFTVIHPESTTEWTLHIKVTTKRDGGVYECQVNSDPKISRRVDLTITDDKSSDRSSIPSHSSGKSVTMIEGLKERHIQEGSILTLTCIVRHSPDQAPKHLLWFHGQEPLDYDSPRGGVSVQTEKQVTRTVSKLSVSSVSQKDSGEYTCSPTDLYPYSVIVHVQNGQHHAAIYQGGISNSKQKTSCFILLILSFLHHTWR